MPSLPSLVLQELQGKADDKWTENNRAELAIYDEGVYGGPDGLDSFVEKWGEMGAALAGSVTVGVSFPEEFNVDHIKSSRQIKSSANKFKLDQSERDALVCVIGFVLGALGEEEDIETYSVAKDVLSEKELKALDHLWSYVLDSDYTYPEITDEILDADEIVLLKKVYDVLYEKDLLDWDAESAFESICGL